jgi:hypothetical protein
MEHNVFVEMVPVEELAGAEARGGEQGLDPP